MDDSRGEGEWSRVQMTADITSCLATFARGVPDVWRTCAGCVPRGCLACAEGKKRCPS